MLCLAVRLAAAPSSIVSVLVNDHRRPLPGNPPTGWYYNCMGGDVGLIGDADADPQGLATFQALQPRGWRLTIARQPGLWSAGGTWYSLIGPRTSCRTVKPSALYHPVIIPALQPRLVGVDILLLAAESAKERSDLHLKLELKGYATDGGETTMFSKTWRRAEFLDGPFPKRLACALPPEGMASVGLLTLVLDRAGLGDNLTIGDMRLRVEIPALPVAREAALFSLGMLLRSYDDATGMVNDRANFPLGTFENVTSTGKCAKVLAQAIVAGMVDERLGREMIVKSATALLRLPRGPVGVNALWPHFTRSGGAEIVPGSEWASGDTAYALLDMMVALAMIGDPGHQLADLLAVAQGIDWLALKAANGGFHHGYDQTGKRLPGIWHGFGVETFGVLVAAKLAGVEGIMGPPPTDNGSGFLTEALYPIIPDGIDAWGNDWRSLRLAGAMFQVGWYRQASHANPWLADRWLFGLSGAESPQGWHGDAATLYQAYGVGGTHAVANFQDVAGMDVVVGHYSGMVSALLPVPARAAWLAMREAGLMSPLNNLESASVDAVAGPASVNYLQGSWNLCLQAEGWLVGNQAVALAVNRCLPDIPGLQSALDFCLTPATASNAPKPWPNVRR